LLVLVNVLAVEAVLREIHVSQLLEPFILVVPKGGCVYTERLK
jgi:hypothetical protein